MATPAPPPECANCGTSLPRSARACPECGADERTGWRENDIYDGLDLPEEAWEESNFEPPLRRHIAWYWWLAGMAVLIAFLFTVLGLG